MKKLETLKKELERIAENDFIAKLKAIAENESVNDFESFEKREALALLQYAELAKALQNKKYTLVLDMNYVKCRAKEINFYRYSLLDTHNKRALHLYQHTNTFDICFSADKDTRAKVEAIEALNKTITTQVADTTVFKKVHFDDMLDACKFALLLLESTLDNVKAYVEKQSDTESDTAE
jgi:iron only hydrogenase large subunit-like protein